jgi:hypothetical protein
MQGHFLRLKLLHTTIMSEPGSASEKSCEPTTLRDDPGHGAASGYRATIDLLPEAPVAAPHWWSGSRE